MTFVFLSLDGLIRYICFPVSSIHLKPRMNYLYENLSTSHGLPPFELLVREAAKITKPIETIAIALSFPSLLDDKVLFLKTP